MIGACEAVFLFTAIFSRAPEDTTWMTYRTEEHAAATLFSTPEGQTLYSDQPWQMWVPHLANAARSECGTPPSGWVDAGHGVYVPPILLSIRWCESRDDYLAANRRSSARGAYQFIRSSWRSYGHAARYGVTQAHHATPAQQDEAAVLTWQRDGTRPWNASRHCWG